jgi:hypothetical protein
MPWGQPSGAWRRGSQRGWPWGRPRRSPQPPAWSPYTLQPSCTHPAHAHARGASTRAAQPATRARGASTRTEQPATVLSATRAACNSARTDNAESVVMQANMLSSCAPTAPGSAQLAAALLLDMLGFDPLSLNGGRECVGQLCPVQHRGS